MTKISCKILFLFLLINISCVENIIFFQIHPNGKTYLKFKSSGDSLDIYNKDFNHPKINSSLININQNDSIWIMTTEALYEDSIYISNDKNGLSYTFKRSEEKNIFYTFYDFEVIFSGRKIKNNYPDLFTAIINDKIDSLSWLPKVLTKIIAQSLSELKTEGERYDFNIDRVVNHFRNSFSRIDSYKKLEHIKNNRIEFIKNTMKPFKTNEQFAKILAKQMESHEKYLKTTIDLNDDIFKVKIKMPGQILSSNASTINKDTLFWEFGLDSLLNNDFSLNAKSAIKINENIKKISILIICLLLTLAVIIIFKVKK